MLNILNGWSKYYCTLTSKHTLYPVVHIWKLGWSGGAMVLGKLPVPGGPTNLDYSRARAYCACSRCGWGCLDIFSLIYHFSFLSHSLWVTALYRLKYCLKGLLSLRTANQLHLWNFNSVWQQSVAKTVKKIDNFSKCNLLLSMMLLLLFPAWGLP